VVFGSAKLPHAERSLGRSIRIFKSEIGQAHEEPSPQQMRQQAARLRAEAARLEQQAEQRY
jgi:Sec-independent protein translocase protein TatA